MQSNYRNEKKTRPASQRDHRFDSPLWFYATNETNTQPLSAVNTSGASASIENKTTSDNSIASIIIEFAPDCKLSISTHRFDQQPTLHKTLFGVKIHFSVYLNRCNEVVFHISLDVIESALSLLTGQRTLKPTQADINILSSTLRLRLRNAYQHFSLEAMTYIHIYHKNYDTHRKTNSNASWITISAKTTRLPSPPLPSCITAPQYNHWSLSVLSVFRASSYRSNAICSAAPTSAAEDNDSAYYPPASSTSKSNLPNTAILNPNHDIDKLDSQAFSNGLSTSQLQKLHIALNQLTTTAKKDNLCRANLWSTVSKINLHKVLASSLCQLTKPLSLHSTVPTQPLDYLKQREVSIEVINNQQHPLLQ